MMFFSSLRARTLPWLGCLGLLVSACGSDDPKATAANVMVSNDFESMAGWMGATPNPTLTREKAHSGKYSIKVDANSEFSLTFASTFGALHDVRVNKMKVTAWVFVPSAQAVGMLVTHAGDAPPRPAPMIYDALNLPNAVDGKYNQWVQVSKIIPVPAEVLATTNIGFYLWRASGNQPVYLDDLVVTAEQ